MIEKATSCLNHGGKKIAINSSKLNHTRRALHSSFWSHGAGDIELPLWWNSYLKNPNITQLASHVSNCSIRSELQSSFLDFLYPPQTIRFAQKISSRRYRTDTKTEAKKPRGRSATRRSKRVSTADQWKTTHDDPEISTTEAVGDGQAPEQLSSQEAAYISPRDWGAHRAKHHDGSMVAEITMLRSIADSKAKNESKKHGKDGNASNIARSSVEQLMEVGKSKRNETPNEYKLFTPPASKDSSDFYDLDETIIQQAMEQAMLDTEASEPTIDPSRQASIAYWSRLSAELGQVYEEYLDLLDTTNAIPQAKNNYATSTQNKMSIIKQQMETTLETGAKFVDALLKHLREKVFPQDRAQWSENQWAFFIRLVFLHPKKSIASPLGLNESSFPTGQRGVFRLLVEAASYGKALASVRDLLRLTVARAQAEFANSLLVFGYKQKMDVNSILTDITNVTAPILGRWIVDLHENIKIPGYLRLRKDLYSTFQPNRQSYLDLANLMTEYLLQREMTLDMNAATYEKVWAAFLNYEYLSSKHFVLGLNQLNSINSEDVSELTAFVNVGYKLFVQASSRPDFVWEEVQARTFLQRMALTHHHHCWKVYQYYHHKFGYHSETYKIVLQELSSAGEAEHWEEVFAELQAHDSVDRVEWIHQLLVAYAKRANVHACRTILGSIETEFRRLPDLASWNAVLSAYLRAADMPGALEFHEYMKSRGVERDVSTSILLLQGWATRGEYAQASEQLARIRAEGHELNGKMISILVSACLHNEDMDTAEQLLFDTIDIPTPDSKTEAWNAVLTSYGHQGKLADMNYIHGLMSEHGIEDNEDTYAALIRGFCTAGLVSLALKIITEVMPMYNMVPTIYHWNLLIQALNGKKQFQTALQLYQSLKKQHLKPDITTQSLALHAMASRHGFIAKGQKEFPRVKERAFAQAEEFLRQNLAEDIPQHAVSKSPMMGRDGQPVDQAFASLQFSTLLMHGTQWTDQQRDEHLERYQAFYAEKYPNQELAPPTRMLTAMANHCFATGNLGGIDEIWREALERMTKFALRTDSDPSQPDHILRSRAHLLGPLFKPYMLSLLKRGEDILLGRTITQLTRAGWRFSSAMWDVYIVSLAKRGEVHLAFQYTETHLINGFRGWPRAQMKKGMTPRWSLNKDPPGTRRWKVNKPAYETLVWLAHAYIVWRRKNAFNVQRGDSLAELWKLAPKTMRHVSLMPRLNDKEQYLILQHATYGKEAELQTEMDENDHDDRPAPAFEGPVHPAEIEGMRI